MWQAFLTEDGKTYYFNELTNKTQWDPPSEPFHPARAPSPAPIPVSSSVPQLPVFTDEEFEKEVFEDMLAKAGTQNARFEQEAQLFKKMLWDLRLPDGITWTETMELHQARLQTDPRFLSVPPHRRAVLFGELQISRKAVLIRREEKERKFAADNFVAALERHAEEIGVGVPFEKVEKQFGTSDWWKAVNDPDRRLDLYDDWSWEHEKAHIAAQEKAVAAAAEALKEELKTVVRSETFTFASFCSLFAKSQAFQTLPRKARIELFSAHIRSLEDIVAKNELEEKKHKHWGSLTVREALLSFLKKLAAEEKIHYASSWADV